MSTLNDHSTRDHALLSASSAARWLACPPSAVAAELYPEQDTDYTKEGTLAHEVAERIAHGTSICGKSFCEGLVGNEIHPEITPEMLDCATGYADYIEERLQNGATVLLEQRVDFSPWVPEGFGTADCIILQGDGTMDVVDYKYGKGVAVSAKDNPQMKLYGLGALNDYGFACDIKKVRLHIYQPRLNNISVDELSVDELLAWADKTVKPTAAKAAVGKGKHTPGEHCRFCPHAGNCRALTKTCTQYIETHGIKVGVESLAPWEVAEVLRMEPLVSLWLKRVKEQALTTLLNGGEVPGFKAVAGRGTRAWKNELEVAEKLLAGNYAEWQYTKTELLSPAAMEKAIGKKAVAELLEGLIETKTGSPTVAPETDKRPVYDRLGEAQKDFE